MTSPAVYIMQRDDAMSPAFSLQDEQNAAEAKTKVAKWEAERNQRGLSYPQWTVRAYPTGERL